MPSGVQFGDLKIATIADVKKAIDDALAALNLSSLQHITSDAKGITSLQLSKNGAAVRVNTEASSAPIAEIITVRSNADKVDIAVGGVRTSNLVLAADKAISSYGDGKWKSVPGNPSTINTLLPILPDNSGTHMTSSATITLEADNILLKGNTSTQST